MSAPLTSANIWGIPSPAFPARWASSGNILVEKDGAITLTDSGKKLAETIYERHTVLSELLIRLGVDEKTATDDACRIEHVISDESFQAIKQYYYRHKK